MTTTHRGKLVRMHTSVHSKVRNSVSSSISTMTSSTQRDGVGSIKRAVKLGQMCSNGPMLKDYTVGYSGVDMLTLKLCDYGLGLFTLVPILANQLIIAARGQLQLRSVNQSMDEMKYTWEPNPPGLYVFSQWEEEDANIMRFVNSSRGYGDAPNAVVEWRVDMKIPFLRALTDILPDASGCKQILVDYDVGV